MSQASGREESAVHHVDSTLGLLLAIVVFLTGLTFNILQTTVSESVVPDAIRSALGIASALVLWLTGVLRQAWLPKLVAWGVTMYQFLMPVFVLLIIYTGMISGAIASPYLRHLGVPAACIGSSLFLWYIVRRAYQSRLLLAGDSRAQRDQIGWYSKRLAWAVSVIGFIIYLQSVLSWK